MNPLVSIIIPTYNRAHLISETLDSVLAQTYHNWECIIVDDGSQDNTEEVVTKYIKNDNRFKYYKRPKESMKGAGSCRNYGFKMSNGKFVNWFDDDDIMLSGFLEKRLKMFDSSPKLDVVFCAFQVFDVKRIRDRMANIQFNGNIIKSYIDSEIVFGPQSYLMRREILQDFLFDEHLQRAEDADFFLRLFSTKEAIKISHIAEVLFYVRTHKKTITLNDDKEGKRLNSQFIVRKKILDYATKIQYQKGILKYKSSCLMDLKRLVDNKNYRLAILNILRSLRLLALLPKLPINMSPDSFMARSSQPRFDAFIWIARMIFPSVSRQYTAGIPSSLCDQRYLPWLISRPEASLRIFGNAPTCVSLALCESTLMTFA